MMTFTIPAARASAATVEHKAVETVLHDIRVIAIDQRLESKAGEAVPAHTATFEVTPKQSEIIALASKMGEMFLDLAQSRPRLARDAGRRTGGRARRRVGTRPIRRLPRRRPAPWTAKSARYCPKS